MDSIVSKELESDEEMNMAFEMVIMATAEMVQKGLCQETLDGIDQMMGEMIEEYK